MRGHSLVALVVVLAGCEPIKFSKSSKRDGYARLEKKERSWNALSWSASRVLEADDHPDMLRLRAESCLGADGDLADLVVFTYDAALDPEPGADSLSFLARRMLNERQICARVPAEECLRWCVPAWGKLAETFNRIAAAGQEHGVYIGLLTRLIPPQVPSVAGGGS